MQVYGNHCNCGRISRATQPEPAECPRAEEQAPKPKSGRGPNGKHAVLVDGLLFPSFVKAAEHLGVPAWKVRNAHNRGEDLDGHRIEEAKRCCS